MSGELPGLSSGSSMSRYGQMNFTLIMKACFIASTLTVLSVHGSLLAGRNLQTLGIPPTPIKIEWEKYGRYSMFPFEDLFCFIFIWNLNCCIFRSHTEVFPWHCAVLCHFDTSQCHLQRRNLSWENAPPRPRPRFAFALVCDTFSWPMTGIKRPHSLWVGDIRQQDEQASEQLLMTSASAPSPGSCLEFQT